MALNIDFLKTRQNNLKSLASSFQVVLIHFHPRHLQPKTLVDSFSTLNIAVGNKNGPLFLGFPPHKYIFWLSKEMLKICDRALSANIPPDWRDMKLQMLV